MCNRNILIACSISIVLLSLSPLAFGQGQVLHKTLMHDGVERTYILYVPSTYSAGEATPLVLNLHGKWGNADQQMTTSAMNAVAEEELFLVAYPNSVYDSWNLDTDADVRFMDALLGSLGSQYEVDASRVYSTGFSAGGILSYVLAVIRPDTFAAIAPVAGFRRIDSEQDSSGLIPSWAPRVPPRPFPLMHVHGTADLTVPYDGGTGLLGGPPFPSLEASLNEWLACNGCDTTPSLSELPDIVPYDESTVSVLSYGNCGTYLSAGGEEIVADVVHYRVNGGRHSWPVLEADRAASLAAMEATWGTGSLPYLLPLNSDFSASAVMWEFFEQHVVAVPEPADFDSDGDVDGDDFLAWQTGFGIASGAQKADGDYDNDGDVDGNDFLGWQAEFGSGDGSASAAVPEPASMALVIAVAAAGMFSRRRGHRHLSL